MIRRLWALLALTALTCLAVPSALHLRIDSGTQGWIDRHGPAATALAEVERRFGRQDGFVIALFGSDVLGPPAIDWQRAVSSACERLPGVDTVDSLPNAKAVAMDDLGPAAQPLLDQPRAAILGNGLYAGLLVAPDGQACALLVRPSLDLAADDIRRLAERIQQVLAQSPPPTGFQVVLGGLPIQQDAIASAVSQDQRLTIPVMALALLIVLALALRHALLVATIAIGVASTLLMLFALLTASGTALDALLGLLPPLVVGIGVASALHLTFALARAYADAEAHPRRAALRALRVPGILALLTALAGIGGLLVEAVPAVRFFAPWAMLSVLIASCVPCGWLLAMAPLMPVMGWRRLATASADAPRRTWLLSIAHAAQRHAAGVLLLTAVLAIGAAGMLSRLHADVDMLHALPKAMPARLAEEAIDARLTGALGMDVLIDPGHPPTAADIEALADLERWLRLQPTVAHALSLADVTAYLQAQGDRRDVAGLIDDLGLGARPLLDRFLGPSLRASPQRTTLRIAVRQHDASIADAVGVAQATQDRLRARWPQATCRISSGALLLAETSARLVPATLSSLLCAKLAVALLLLLALRSVRLAILAAVVVLLPLLATYALLPLLGWPLDIGISMIACIALGMIMNDTVHLVHAFHRMPLSDAYQRCGRPVLLAGVALLIAFAACDLGSFAYTRRMGVLLSCAFAVGIATNLIVAPALHRLLLGRSVRIPDQAQIAKDAA